MATAALTIASKNYGSWSLRGWLLCKLAGLDFDEQSVASDDPSTRAELLLLSPSFLVPCLTHDGIKIWVNGDLKVSHDLTRGAAPGQEEQPVDLRAGWNEILLKITQGEGGWGFYFDLLTPDRKPLPDLMYSPRRWPTSLRSGTEAVQP